MACAGVLPFLPPHADPPAKAARLEGRPAVPQNDAQAQLRGRGPALGALEGVGRAGASGDAAAAGGAVGVTGTGVHARAGMRGDATPAAVSARAASSMADRRRAPTESGMAEVRSHLSALELALAQLPVSAAAERVQSFDMAPVTVALRKLGGSLSQHVTSSTLSTLASSFDLTVLPALVRLMRTYLDHHDPAYMARTCSCGPDCGTPHAASDARQAFPAATAERHAATTPAATSAAVVADANPVASHESPVPDDTAIEILCCLVNFGSGDSHMTRLMIKHDVISLAVRALRVCCHPLIVENAIWILGNIAGDGAAARDEVIRQGGYDMVLGHAAGELHKLGYWPFGTRLLAPNVALALAAPSAHETAGHPSTDAVAAAVSPGVPESNAPAATAGCTHDGGDARPGAADLRPDVGAAVFYGLVELMNVVGAERISRIRAQQGNASGHGADACALSAATDASDARALHSVFGDKEMLALGNMLLGSPAIQALMRAAATDEESSENTVPTTSVVLKIATWALNNICEAQPRPAVDTPKLLAVLNVCLDVPDAEVLSHVSWALSHLCDGPNDAIHATLSSLACPTFPHTAIAMHRAPVLSPAEFVALAVGQWSAHTYSPPEDFAFATADLPTSRREQLAQVQRAHLAVPVLRCAFRAPTGFMGYVPSTASKLARLLRHDSVRVCKPALRAVGNIVCAEDDADFTQAVVDIGVVPSLGALMDYSAREVQKEACWTLSNITAGSPEQIQEVLNARCLARALDVCADPAADAGVRTEACWMLLNATSCGNEHQVETLVRAGVVRVLCAIISDASMHMTAMDALEKILQVCERLSAAAANLMVAKGRAPSLAIAPTTSIGTRFDNRRVTVASSRSRGTTNKLGVRGREAHTQVGTQDAGDSAPTHGLYGPDVSLEDVFLAEAKLLVDTCRAELLSNPQLKGGSSAEMPVPSDSTAPAGSRHESAYKRAARLWASHFVTCGLCQRTYSKNSRATTYCDECRCTVCPACNCEVYHLSHQLRLLEESADAGRGSRKGTTPGSKSKGKRGKKERSQELTAKGATTEVRTERERATAGSDEPCHGAASSAGAAPMRAARTEAASGMQARHAGSTEPADASSSAAAEVIARGATSSLPRETTAQDGQASETEIDGDWQEVGRGSNPAPARASIAARDKSSSATAATAITSSTVAGHAGGADPVRRRTSALPASSIAAASSSARASTATPPTSTSPWGTRRKPLHASADAVPSIASALAAAAAAAPPATAGRSTQGKSGRPPASDHNPPTNALLAGSMGSHAEKETPPAKRSWRAVVFEDGGSVSAGSDGATSAQQPPSNGGPSEVGHQGGAPLPHAASREPSARGDSSGSATTSSAAGAQQPPLLTGTAATLAADGSDWLQFLTAASQPSIGGALSFPAHVLMLASTTGQSPATILHMLAATVPTSAPQPPATAPPSSGLPASALPLRTVSSSVTPAISLSSFPAISPLPAPAQALHASSQTAALLLPGVHLPSTRPSPVITAVAPAATLRHDASFGAAGIFIPSAGTASPAADLGPDDDADLAAIAASVMQRVISSDTEQISPTAASIPARSPPTPGTACTDSAERAGATSGSPVAWSASGGGTRRGPPPGFETHGRILGLRPRQPLLSAGLGVSPLDGTVAPFASSPLIPHPLSYASLDSTPLFGSQMSLTLPGIGTPLAGEPLIPLLLNPDFTPAIGEAYQQPVDAVIDEKDHQFLLELLE